MFNLWLGFRKKSPTIGWGLVTRGRRPVPSSLCPSTFMVALKTRPRARSGWTHRFDMIHHIFMLSRLPHCSVALARLSQSRLALAASPCISPEVFASHESKQPYLCAHLTPFSLCSVKLLNAWSRFTSLKVVNLHVLSDYFTQLTFFVLLAWML